MKVRWRRFFLWSSLGSVAVGVSVALVRKSRRPEHRQLDYEVIPAAAGIDLRTGPFEAGTPPAKVRDRYVLRPTGFKVWSVLDLPAESAEGNPAGAPIYHVTHTRSEEKTGVPAAVDQVLDRFYATMQCVDPENGLLHQNRVAPGAVLELPRCYVGGTSNGIESGEVHRSGAPILEYHIEPTGGAGSTEESSL